MTASSSQRSWKGSSRGQHALGVVERPAHVGVGHQVDVVADDLAHVADELEVLLHSGGAVERAPAEAQLHHLVAFVLVLLRLGAKLGDGHGVEAAGVDGDVLLGAATEQAERRAVWRPCP